MITQKILPASILIAILLYGFFRIWFCRMYSIPIEHLLEISGYSSEEILEMLNDFSSSTKTSDHYLGWFIYYPTYLLLHLLFIHSLFGSQKKIRNTISIALLVVVSGLFVLVLIGKVFELTFLFNVSYSLFQNLFGLPFILLAIEGGRVLLRDIERLTTKNKVKP